MRERLDRAVMMLAQWQRAPTRRRTVGADKAYDDPQFVGLMREVHMTPHVTQNLSRPGGDAIIRARRATTVRDESACAPPDRTGIRVAEDDRLDAEGEAPGAAQGGLAVRVRERGLQFRSVAEAAAAAGLTGAPRPRGQRRGLPIGTSAPRWPVSPSRPPSLRRQISAQHSGSSAASFTMERLVNGHSTTCPNRYLSVNHRAGDNTTLIDALSPRMTNGPTVPRPACAGLHPRRRREQCS